MHASTLQGFLQNLRRLTDPNRSRELSDADLLERFRQHHEEAAFTLLVQRHGPMVLSVCRRLLGNVHEVEDVFQATFLVLVRKAGTIHKQESLASWLHRVACRLALKARAQSAELANGRRPPAGGADQPADTDRSLAIHDDPSETLAAAELRSALDEEIERLPEKYRTPIVLCYLADKTHEQAAGELGCPKSSVTSRLAKARQLLRQRLLRRGFAAPVGLLAALLTEATANAAVPSLLTLSTVRLAVQALSGEAMRATATIALADSFLQGAISMKWTMTAALLATLGFAAVVGSRLMAPGFPSPQAKAAIEVQAVGKRRETKPEPPKPRLDLQGDPLPDGVLARMGSGRMRHPGHVRVLAFAADGKTLVSGGDNGLRVWDTDDGKLRQRLEKLHPEFDLARGWNLAFTLRRRDIVAAEVGPQKRIVTVRFFHANMGKLRRRIAIKEQATIPVLAFAPDGGRIAFPIKNGVGVFDTASGERTLRIDVPEGAAHALAFAADGKSLAFVAKADTVRICDSRSGKIVREIRHEGCSIFNFSFSPDRRFLAATSWNAKQRNGEGIVWDLATGAERHRLKPPSDYAHCVAFSPDGKFMAMGGPFHDVVLWDMATGREVRRFAARGYVVSLAFAPDGKSVAAAGGDSILQWDAETGRVLPASADPFLAFAHGLHFDASGKQLHGAGLERFFTWDAATGRELQRLPRRIDDVWDLSPDGALRAATNREEKTIHLHDAKTGKEVRVLKGHEKRVWDMVFSPDGRQLISTSEDATIRVWDVVKGHELRKWDAPHNRFLTISPDDRWLATANNRHGQFSGYEIQLWDRKTGRQKRHWTVATPTLLVLEMRFSPDSRYLAIGGGVENGPGELKLWNVEDGKLLRAFEGHDKHVLGLAFSPDSRTMATGDMNGTLILWELASGRRRHSFQGHESGVSALAFSPDGRRLAAASAEAPVYIWDVMALGESTPRSLSGEELQRAWSNLGSDDAVLAYQSIRRLAAVPERTMPFLRQHLKPASAPDPKRVRQLVKMLDSDDFPTRKKAVEELEKQTDAATVLLRQVMANEKPSLEVRRRLQQILEAVENKPELRRCVRAVEVLEWIATPDAVRLLDELANGAADARLTREADTARRRLRRKDS